MGVPPRCSFTLSLRYLTAREILTIFALSRFSCSDIKADETELHRYFHDRGEELWLNLTATDYFKKRSGSKWPPISALVH
jgi:hypothetical protein